MGVILKKKKLKVIPHKKMTVIKDGKKTGIPSSFETSEAIQHPEQHHRNTKLGGVIPDAPKSKVSRSRKPVVKYYESGNVQPTIKKGLHKTDERGRSRTRFSRQSDEVSRRRREKERRARKNK